jgi:hypothetical protein
VFVVSAITMRAPEDGRTTKNAQSRLTFSPTSISMTTS